MSRVYTGRSELILGGQKSGKSRRAEMLACEWLRQSADHTAWVVVTGLAGDAEMAERIARHQQDRAVRAPGLQTLEQPIHLAQGLHHHDHPKTLLVVDCLTTWLTHRMFPPVGAGMPPAVADSPSQAMAAVEDLVHTLRHLQSSVVLVSNEIGWGVIPMGQQVRAFVDVLGVLNQTMAQLCQRVTLMVAGQPLALKDAPQAPNLGERA